MLERLDVQTLYGFDVVTTTLTAAIASIALASESVTYIYDARGRLVKIEHSGSANNGIVANYTLDKAENRVEVKITGAPR